MNPRTGMRRAFDAFDALCARAFTPDWNPMVQLGALGWFLFWIVVVSGVYLYIFFDTGVQGTYASIEAITHEQWWAGGVLRSLHRYASDALLLLAVVHLLREWSRDRMRGNHWFAWITGLPLLGFIYVCGISGYWLVWDTLAQYVAITTSDLLDALPIFGEPIARNFLDQASVSDRFFTLMVLIHIAAPLLMLLFMWVHISRHANSRVNPALGLGVAVLVVLTLASLLWPALSQGPANLDKLPAVVGLDWWYLAAYPLVDTWGGAIVWLMLLGIGLLLGLLPWLPPRRPAAAAVVSLADCNGCGRCFADCPFGAITLAARTDGLPYQQQAIVDESLCMGCGLCVAACPTATPARSSERFVAGIELPAMPLDALRERIRSAAAGLRGSSRVIVFTCPHGAPCPAGDDGMAVFEVPCPAALPPPFIDWILTRQLADGVALAGCAPGDCHHRLGDRWVEERIAGERDPWLRGRVPRDRVAVSWLGHTDRQARNRALGEFRASLATLPPLQRGMNSQPTPPTHLRSPSWPRPVRWAGLALLLAAPVAGIVALAAWPAWTRLDPGLAVVHLAFRHASEPKVPCAKLTAAEMKDLKPNMRRPVDCPRERWPVVLELERDGKVVYRATHAPTGLWNDGPASALERFTFPAGKQVLQVRLRDTGRAEGFDYERRIEVDLAAAQNFVIEFQADKGFVFH